MPETSEIQRLDNDTIRRITAEQAISDLPSIVKELIDNALDAESTTIKIRLFGQGLDIIEVSDDGNGVPAGSRPYMATRHATSKIECLEDIYEGTGLTMGFRGEALFAMACVSESLVVATRTDEDELATKILFGKDGKPLGEETPLARKVGTTIAVVKPFGNLPARRADLVRRIKQERTRIFKLVESYGIFNVGVCFRLMDINNNREDVALATSASSTKLQETASTLLGPAFLKGTKAFELCLESFFRDKQKKEGENNDQADDICYNWGVKGLISAEPSLIAAQQRPQRRGGSFGGVSSAQQASSRARIVQYYSINGRVVEVPKVTALLKRLWQTFSSSMGGLKQKKPSAILEFTLPNNAFDINLSPDKKTVLLTHEEEILGIIEEQVTKIWSDESSNVFVDGSLSQLQETKQQKKQQPTNDHGYDRDDLYENEDESDRQKYDYEHKRRFAFSHDISKAKMQHDMPYRRASYEQTPDSPQPTPTLKQTTITPIVVRKLDSVRNSETTEKTVDDSQTVSQSESHHELQQSPNKEIQLTPKDGGNQTEEASASLSTNEEEPSRAPSPEGKVSDLDRRKWTEIQAKFSQDDSPIEKHLPHKEHDREYEDDAIMTPANTAITPEDSTKQSLPTVAPSSSHRRRNLQDFAFQSGTQNDPVVDKNDSYARRKRAIMPPPDERPPAQIDSKTGEQSPDESIRPSKKRKGSGEHESIQPPVADSDRRIQDDAILSTVMQDTEISASEEKSPTTVVWKCFSSTEDICISSREERLNMKQRKREINEIRRIIRNQQNSDSTTRKENTRRASTSEDDIVKEVTFDDDGDGDENDSGLIRMPKSTFRNGMQVIGQFNLGFILARCSRNHLWILDQHACDETYNYEQLCKNTVIHQQPLIKPLPLELTPSEEACVLDNMDIFEANGFKFSFDDQAPIRHRLSLTSLPHSGAHEGRKAVQFGPSDVSTLCSILTEGSSYDAGSGGTGTDGSGMYGNNAVRRHAGASGSTSDRSDRLLARLPKAIAMFASRACRTSIMIGTALSHKEMSSIVQKLAKVDKPWNCPHGRPTMRHVANVLPLLLKDERKAAEHIAVPTITVVPMTQEEDQQAS